LWGGWAHAPALAFCDEKIPHGTSHDNHAHSHPWLRTSKTPLRPAIAEGVVEPIFRRGFIGRKTLLPSCAGRSDRNARDKTGNGQDRGQTEYPNSLIRKMTNVRLSYQSERVNRPRGRLGALLSLEFLNSLRFFGVSALGPLPCFSSFYALRLVPVFPRLFLNLFLPTFLASVSSHFQSSILFRLPESVPASQTFL